MGTSGTPSAPQVLGMSSYAKHEEGVTCIRRAALSGGPRFSGGEDGRIGLGPGLWVVLGAGWGGEAGDVLRRRFTSRTVRGH